MSNQPPVEAVAASRSGNYQQQVRERIESISYLPTTAAVAIKFVELGKNPEAEPSEYAKVIEADSSLSTKLLALSNSSWAGVRQKVTTVKMAVNLLGLGTVRTLAISYCMTGLHNELRLSPAESEVFWEASLSKAVAAKHYAKLFDEKAADEAYVAGLFQDFALTVMYSVLRERYLALLQDSQLGVAALRQRERELFGMDHAEVGRLLAQKLELPELFVDTVAFHHDHDRLCELLKSAPLRDAAHVAGMFPHALTGWNKGDAEACATFVEEHAPSTTMEEYVTEVQKEFAQVYTYFNEGKTPQGELTELLTKAAREVADNTTELVGRVNGLLEQVASSGAVASLQTGATEREKDYDRLTGVPDRTGFETRAGEELAKAARYAVAFGLCCFNLDRFRDITDTHGQEFGNRVLKALVAEIQSVAPDDAVVGRLGNDEFAMLLCGCSRNDAIEAAEQIVSNLAAKPITMDDRSARVTVSAGVLFVRSTTQQQQLDVVLKAAEKLMATAKRSGGNQLEVRIV